MKYTKVLSKFLIVCVLFLIFSSCASNSLHPNKSFRAPSSLGSNKIKFFDPSKLNEEKVTLQTYDLDSDLVQFTSSLETFVDEYKKRKSEDGTDLNQQVVGKGFVAPYNSFALTSKGVYQAVKKMLALVSKIKDGQNVEESKYQIAQLAQAIEHLYDVPVKTDYEMFTMPVYLNKMISSPTVLDKNLNQQTPEFLVNELQYDYKAKDTNFIDYMSLKNSLTNCEYSKPKAGYGVHPGFHIKCDNNAYKVKFGNEIYSGSLNSRIYRALGYRVPEINYVEKLTLKYNRKILTEFNSRKNTMLKFKLAGITVIKMNKEILYDPFDYILLFKLKDGSLLTPKELKPRLLKKSDVVKVTDENINDAFDAKISDVILRPATLTTKNDDLLGEEVGPWSALDLDYRDYKEIRSLIVASAWIGNFDLRKDNLGVFLAGKDSGQQVKIGLSDIGSGLGNTMLSPLKGILSSSSVNDFAWTISATRSDGNVRLSGFMTLEVNKVYSKISFEDAQWMLEKMCQIKSDQIKQGLVGSGMSSAEVTVAYAKLINRRNKMLDDFKVSDELKKSCFTQVTIGKDLNYDPRSDGLVSVYSDLKKQNIEAPIAGRKVIHGKIVPVSQKK